MEQTTIKEIQAIIDVTGSTDRIFDETNENFEIGLKDYNLLFLRSQQTYFNDLLQARGNVFLNEVYDALGFPRVPKGQLVWWLASEGHYIDFKIIESDTAFGLRFNRGGIIYDKI